MESESHAKKRRNDHLCFQHWLLLLKVSWSEMTDLQVGIQPLLQPRQAALEKARLCPRCHSRGDVQDVVAALDPGAGGLASSPADAIGVGRSSGNWPEAPAAGFGALPTHTRPGVSKGWMIVGVAVFACAVAVMVMLFLHTLNPRVATGADVQAAQTVREDVDFLNIGDCLPKGFPDGDVDLVEVGSCSQPHWEEVYAVFDLPSGAAPSQHAEDRRSDEGCVKRFKTFVGSGIADSNLDYDYVSPYASDWPDESSVVCVVMDSAPVTGTLKGARR